MTLGLYMDHHVPAAITGGGRVYDMIDRKDITADLTQMELAAGEGRVLLVGNQAHVPLRDGVVGHLGQEPQHGQPGVPVQFGDVAGLGGNGDGDAGAAHEAP